MPREPTPAGVHAMKVSASETTACVGRRSQAASRSAAFLWSGMMRSVGDDVMNQTATTSHMLVVGEQPRHTQEEKKTHTGDAYNSATTALLFLLR